MRDTQSLNLNHSVQFSCATKSVLGITFSYTHAWFFIYVLLTFTPLISSCLAKDLRLLAALVLWSFWGPRTVTTRALGIWVLIPLDLVNTSNLAISNKMTWEWPWQKWMFKTLWHEASEGRGGGSTRTTGISIVKCLTFAFSIMKWLGTVPWMGC